MSDVGEHGVRRRERRNGVWLYLYVAAGTALGGVARALVSFAALDWFGAGFPWGTLIVNVVGSFLIGFYATLTGPDGRLLTASRTRQFVMSGVCGGFTTFSVFSLESVRFIASAQIGLAVLNVSVSVVTWLVAAWAGHTMAARFNRLGGS